MSWRLKNHKWLRRLRVARVKNLQARCRSSGERNACSMYVIMNQSSPRPSTHYARGIKRLDTRLLLPSGAGIPKCIICGEVPYAKMSGRWLADAGCRRGRCDAQAALLYSLSPLVTTPPGRAQTASPGMPRPPGGASPITGHDHSTGERVFGLPERWRLPLAPGVNGNDARGCIAWHGPRNETM